jgi:hypothetical protein
MSHDDDASTIPPRNPRISELIKERLADTAWRRLLRGGIGATALSLARWRHDATAVDDYRDPAER